MILFYMIRILCIFCLNLFLGPGLDHKLHPRFRSSRNSMKVLTARTDVSYLRDYKTGGEEGYAGRFAFRVFLFFSNPAPPTVGQVILATKKVANCKKTPKIRQYFLVAKLFGGKAVIIGTKSTKNVPLQCTRCSVSFKNVEYYLRATHSRSHPKIHMVRQKLYPKLRKKNHFPTTATKNHYPTN